MTKSWQGRPKHSDVAVCFMNSVRNERIRLRLTQKEFAELMRVGHSTISKWENGDKVGVLYCYYIWTRGPLAAADVARRIIEGCY
jgi:hypothetical protein